MRRSLPLVILALFVPVVLISQMTSKNMIAGTWKMNVALSKIDPGPKPVNETVIVADDGSIKVQEEFTDGKSASWSVTPNADGTPASIQGLGDNATLSSKRMDDRHFEDTWKVGRGTETGKGVISKDGKRLTYTLTGTNSEGKPVHNVQMFEKQ